MRPTNSLIAANSVAIACLIPVAAHQLGAIDHLPDPPSRLFDSDGITESKAAHPFGIPDALPGIASYTTTLALAILARGHPAARKLLAAKLIADGGLATFNLIRQVVVFRKLCSWCTGAALATYAMLYAAKRIPLPNAPPSPPIALTAAVPCRELVHGTRRSTAAISPLQTLSQLSQGKADRQGPGD